MLRKTLLVCGVLSSLLYVAMNILGAMQYEGYRSASQTVSELSAIGAPTRSLWAWLGPLYSLLVIAFGWGVRRSAGRNCPLRVVGSLIIAGFAVTGVAWPFAPMHSREVLAAGGGTLTDTMHILVGIVTALLMMLAIGFGATAFGKRFYLYSIATVVILVAFGTLTGFNAPRISANLSTPWVGVWERINIGAFLLWVAVLATALLRCRDTAAATGRPNTLAA
jgi:hypothetical protein